MMTIDWQESDNMKDWQWKHMMTIESQYEDDSDKGQYDDDRLRSDERNMITIDWQVKATVWWR